jgi:carnitine-CoA ligase
VPPDHRLRLFVGFSEKGSARHFGVRAMGAHGRTELISHAIFADPAGPMAEMTMGRAAPEYEIAVARPDGSRAALGEPGELLVKGVRGVTLFAEYLGDPEATAAAFTPDGFFRTSDQVTMRPDGEMVFNDRLKDMLKVGGENVAASEVEGAVRRVAGVREVAVVGQPHPMLTEVPFAFVIPADDAPGDLAEQIIAACQRDLADFKVPRGVRLVEDFPRSLINKVAKAELRQMLRDEAKA